MPYHPMIDDDDGSSSPVGHGFNDCIGHAMDAEELRSALKDVASSSRKTTGQSSCWTSSEDEADEEGLLIIAIMFSFSPGIFKTFYFPLRGLAFLMTGLSVYLLPFFLLLNKIYAFI
ncbi:GTP-binding protein 1 isoform 1 [Hibiscus syriacus]|uniref:GTP-binding protein 1 isoform 1 n=1 Tax=Hibiscus syriacus TaxID=106335 RepID=A0A6A2YIL2_HIBSY|nr:GTP-binding protein 1 isoform 1 [Hibiscus syriacus]